ncbi:MAG TPA: acyl-CoA dehydrogenase family protein, partial [Candidatus Limnocylindrales bacterium]
MDQLELSAEQRLMQQTTREYVDRVVIPFIRANREREWLFEPNGRLPANILEEADAAGLRGLGVPGLYGGVELDPGTEAQTFALIATELGRGDAGLADKLAQGWKVSVLLRNVAPEHLQAHWFPRYMADPSFLM